MQGELIKTEVLILKNLLILGGAGYIGSHVVKELLKTGKFNITVLDNLSTGFIETIGKIKNSYGEIEFMKLDLSDWLSVNNFFKNRDFTAVFHFAASSVVPESVKLPLKYYLNNSANTAYLIKQCVEKKINNFIFSSSAAVYGEQNAADGVDEEYKTHPINPYGRSKLMIEWMLEDTAAAHESFKYVALRYFNVAGADINGKIGQSTKDATHIIKIAAQTALGKRDKMYIFGDDYPTPDGTCIRDYIHVDDLSVAHIEALDYLLNNPSVIFNVGYARGYSVKEVIDTMKKVSGNNFNVETAARRKGDPAILVADNRKIQKQTSWKPKYDNLDLICKTALEWENNIN